jgi:subtilisin
MKTRCLRVTTLLIIGLVFAFSGAAQAAEKSVIVGFKQKPGPADKAVIHEAKGLIKKTFRIIPAMAVTVSEQGIAKIKKSKNVAYVEDDATVMLVESETSLEYANSWGVERIGSALAHASGNRGAGVKVAVIDTGIDYTHDDLNGNYMGGYDFVFNDADPMDDGYNSHGTHVAGVIAAEENGMGVIGVAPEASLYAVKVLDGAGFGDLSWLIAGIEWAMNNGMDVANLSLGLQSFSQALKDACDAAYNAGVLLVAAAGNYPFFPYEGPVVYPAAYDSVIAVTATLMDDSPWFASASGPEVELAAPGAGIYSTVIGGVYDLLSGTSQAAPHVAGSAALFLTTELEDLNGDQAVDHADLRLTLQATAIDLGDPGKDTVFGFGLVNAAAAAFSNTGPDIFTLLRSSGSPRGDAVSRILEGQLYTINIENNGLKKVSVDVFEGDKYLKKLSRIFRFSDKNGQQATFSIDAWGTAYDVIFTPGGKAGNSADVEITPVVGGVQ